MKKILLIASLVLFLQIQSSAFASDVSGYFDKGLIYSGSSFPQSVAKSNPDTNNKPIPDLSKLKKGEATAQNILGMVEIGDASVAAAANNGGIT